MKNMKKNLPWLTLKKDLVKELREDSIAHLIKEYFTLGDIRNKEMFKYDKDTQKILISKKCLNHILKLTCAELLEQDFDYELVDEINILMGEE